MQTQDNSQKIPESYGPLLGFTLHTWGNGKFSQGIHGPNQATRERVSCIQINHGNGSSYTFHAYPDNASAQQPMQDQSPTSNPAPK